MKYISLAERLKFISRESERIILEEVERGKEMLEAMIRAALPVA